MTKFLFDEFACIWKKFETFGYPGQVCQEEIVYQCNNYKMEGDKLFGLKAFVAFAKGKYDVMRCQISQSIAFWDVQDYLNLHSDDEKQNLLLQAGCSKDVVDALKFEFSEASSENGKNRWKQVADLFQHYFLREKRETLTPRLIEKIKSLFH